MGYFLKFFILFVINSILIMGFFILGSEFNWETQRQFNSLDLRNDPEDVHILGYLVLMFIMSFIANFFIISSMDGSVHESDSEDIAKWIKQISQTR